MFQIFYQCSEILKDGEEYIFYLIENKSNPEKNEVHEFKQTEIFKASDMMVDALTNLLEREQKIGQNKHPLH